MPKIETVSEMETGQFVAECLKFTESGQHADPAYVNSFAPSWLISTFTAFGSSKAVAMPQINQPRAW